MDKIPFEDGTKTQEAYVTINEQDYNVTPAVWQGNTPLSSFNLNKMQDNIEDAINDIENEGIIISSTEPTTTNKRKVWFQHGKNMYDGQDIKNGLWNGGEIVTTNVNGYYIVLEIIGGRTYTISRKNTSTGNSALSLGALTTADYPSNNISVVDTWKTGTNGNLLTITTSTNAKYLFVGLAAGSSSTVTEAVKKLALEELQIEQNNSKTSYEKPIENKIFIKNTNGNYEEFKIK